MDPGVMWTKTALSIPSQKSQATGAQPQLGFGYATEGSCSRWPPFRGKLYVVESRTIVHESTQPGRTESLPLVEQGGRQRISQWAPKGISLAVLCRNGYNEGRTLVSIQEMFRQSRKSVE
jgi:hypothetical protein